jgi:hypothetical protein
VIANLASARLMLQELAQLEEIVGEGIDFSLYYADGWYAKIYDRKANILYRVEGGDSHQALVRIIQKYYGGEK